MQAFIWQNDLIGVTEFVNVCQNKVSIVGRRRGSASDQPGVTGRYIPDVTFNRPSLQAEGGDEVPVMTPEGDLMCKFASCVTSATHTLQLSILTSEPLNTDNTVVLLFSPRRSVIH